MATSSDPTHPKAVDDPDDDVTGHAYRRTVVPDNDVEGHGYRRSALPEDVVDGPAPVAVEERPESTSHAGDVEGHAYRRSALPDDDVEGHATRGKF